MPLIGQIFAVAGIGFTVIGGLAAPPKAEAAYLQLLAGTSSNDVWVFSNYLSSCSNGPSFIAAHYDGVSWRRTRTPVTGACFGVSLVSAATPNDVWIVGRDPRPTAAIGSGFGCYRWNGRDWLDCPPVPAGLVPPSSFTPGLSAIGVGDQSDVWLTGLFVNPAVVAYGHFSLYWNGSRWTNGSFGNPKGYQYVEAYDVATDHQGGVWALTLALKQTGTGQTFYRDYLEHFSGAKWNIISLPAPQDPEWSSGWSKLFGINGSQLVMVRERDKLDAPFSSNAAVSYYVEGVIQSKKVPMSAAYSPVAGSSATDLWAFPIGIGPAPSFRPLSPPRAVHFDADGRHDMVMAVTTPATTEVSAALSFSDSDAWAIAPAAPSSFLEHWDGLRWTEVPAP